MDITFKSSHSKKRSYYYLDRYISLRCSAEMQELNLFPNAKEVTESWAMLEAVVKILKIDSTINRNSEETLVIVVGDGHKPRTAALIAFMSKFHCISVDPLMNFNREKDVNRLQVIKERIEDIFIETEKYKNVIILMPHSHAKLEDVEKGIQKHPKTWIVTMPCCVPHNFPSNCIEYQDNFILSPKNHIKIWNNYMKAQFVYDLSKELYKEL